MSQQHSLCDKMNCQVCLADRRKVPSHPTWHWEGHPRWQPPFKTYVRKPEQPAKGCQDGQQPREEAEGAVMVHLSKEETKGDLKADHS